MKPVIRLGVAQIACTADKDKNLALHRAAIAQAGARGVDLEVTLRHVAMTYGMPLAMANHCGRRGALDFWGGSRIFDADGRCLALAGDGPEIIAADIALKDIGAARHRLPTMRDAAPLTVQVPLAETLRDLR